VNFESTNTFDTSEYFTAKNEQGQITAQIVRRFAPNTNDLFWGYRMLNPGVGGKSQRLRSFGPFVTFQEAQDVIENDFGNDFDAAEATHGNQR
jgi:hypothetical protein